MEEAHAIRLKVDFEGKITLSINHGEPVQVSTYNVPPDALVMWVHPYGEMRAKDLLPLLKTYEKGKDGNS